MRFRSSITFASLLLFVFSTVTMVLAQSNAENYSSEPIASVPTADPLDAANQIAGTDFDATDDAAYGYDSSLTNTDGDDDFGVMRYALFILLGLVCAGLLILMVKMAGRRRPPQRIQL